MDDATNFWGGHDFCWACRVLAEDSPVCVHLEGEVAVLLNPFPVNVGHALVVPRRHIENIYELPDTLSGPVLSMAARVAVAARQAFAAEGVTLRQNNGAMSDQHLFHFHLHIVPRVADDADRFANGTKEMMPLAEQEAVRRRLQDALAQPALAADGAARRR